MYKVCVQVINFSFSFSIMATALLLDMLPSGSVLKGRKKLILGLSSCFGEFYIMVQFCALLFG